MQVCFSLHLFFKGSIVPSCNNCMYIVCRGEPGDEARDKCPHVIVPYVHEQYRECGNLQTVNLEVTAHR